MQTIYHCKSAVQTISPNRAEGIIMPYNVINRRGQYAHQGTKFGLHLFPEKPVFHLHLLDGRLERHGRVLETENQNEGLKGYLEIDSFAYDYIQAQKTGFSTGSMPHLVIITEDGRIDQWVIVECSFGKEQELTNQPGTTTAHIQSFFASPLPNAPIQRSIWIMPEPTTTPTETPPAPLPTPAPTEPTPTPPAPPQIDLSPILQTLQTIDQRLAAIENTEPPTKVLPTEPEPEPEPPKTRIAVAGAFDGRTLQSLLFENSLRTAAAFKSQNHPYQQSNEWWRTVVDRSRELYDSNPPPEETPIIAYHSDQIIREYPNHPINLMAYKAFTEIVPHLMADEAMRVDFTSYGLELVPTLYGSVMYHFFRSMSKVFGLFQVFQPPSDPDWSWPTITSGPVFRRVLELKDESQLTPGNSPIPSSKMGTANIDFNAGSIGARTIITEQLLRGSAPDMMEAAVTEFARAIAAQIDWVLMNGDETDTAANISHVGTAPSGTTYDKVLVLDGLRMITDGTADDQAEATIAVTTPGIGRALMGTRGIIGDDIEHIVMIMCPESARKFAALTAYQSNADVQAGNNTLLTGQLGQCSGVPIVSSDAVELGDAAGDYEDTHAAGTVGQIVFVHRKIVKVAMFQDPRFDTEYYKSQRAFELTTTVDLDIQQLETGGIARLFNNTV